MSFEALRALIIASGYELRFRENEWVECLLIREDEAWLGRGRDRSSALSAAVRLACPSSLARELLSSRMEHLIAEAAAASAEHREKVLDAIASDAPETVPPPAPPPPLPSITSEITPPQIALPPMVTPLPPMTPMAIPRDSDMRIPFRATQPPFERPRAT